MKEYKVAKFPPKVAQKVATSDYIQIATLLKWPKKFQDIGAIIAGKFVTKTFQKQPNLVTLVAENKFCCSHFVVQMTTSLPTPLLPLIQ